MNEKIRRVDLYPGDWIAGLAGLKLGAAAWGVYSAAVLIAYNEGRPSMHEDELVERMAALMGEDPRTIRAGIRRLEMAAKLLRDGRELEPRRVRDELERSARRVRDAREMGAKGGRPRKENKDITKGSGLFSEKLAVSNQQPAISSQQSAATPADAGAKPRHDPELEHRVLAQAKLDESRFLGGCTEVTVWKAQGCSDDDILAGIAAVAERPRYDPAQVRSLRYFTSAVLERRRERMAAEAAGRKPPVAAHNRQAEINRRCDQLNAAKAAAQAAGLNPKSPGWPKLEDFGLRMNATQIEIAA